jgi:Pin2-interacting protein X1
MNFSFGIDSHIYRRTKLAHDPNNTKWAGNTESFGLKLMTAQGWQPGDYLGVNNVKQAEHYTAGSASHIRVMIKDDNLGVGAKNGSGVGHGECTGLDAFKDLLGRLNGKDEDEIEKEKKSREDLKRAIYSERKWGSTRFVKGGFLIGDKIQPLIEAEAQRVRKLAERPFATAQDGSSSSSESDEQKSSVAKLKKSKKRSLENNEQNAEVVAVKVKKSKKNKEKSKTMTEKTEVSAATVQDVKGPEKKSKKNQKGKVEEGQAEDEKRRRKKEKKEMKAEKAAEKLKFNREQDSAEESKREFDSAESSEASSRSATKKSTSLTSAPSSGYSTPMMQGRHAVRSRNIAQKRLANMDVASLNQVSIFFH